MTNFYVYLHIKETDGTPFYVGKGSGNRAYVYGRNDWWKKTVEKYGYDVIILEDNLSEDVSLEREIYWIDRIGRRDLGKGTLVNLTDGGDGISGLIFTEEHKRKIGDSNRGKIHSKESIQNMIDSHQNISDETKRKMSESAKGNTYALGYKHTEEALNKMSESAKGNTNMLGKTHSEESKHQMSLAKIGSKHSKETKLKMAYSAIGKNLGLKRSDATKLKISKIVKGKIWIYNLELKRTKMIYTEELESYLQLDWIKGRKIKWNK
jgi:hypothetical protein